MKKLIAVVLAAGAASRFWPFTTSKVLFPFMGKRLFEFSVRDLLPPEVTDVVIISNNGNKQALESIRLDKPTVMVLQPQPLGMADALLSASGVLKDAQLLVIIADDVLSPSPMKNVVKRGAKGDVFAVIPALEMHEYFPGGYLRIDGDRVLGIVEKPEAGNAPSRFVTASGHFIADSTKLLMELARMKSETDDVYERTMTMLALREHITFEPFEGRFASLKYPWHVLDCMNILFERQPKPKRPQSLTIRSNVIIEGDVWLGENVKIFENTKITGPCYIGDNTIIGSNNMIRASHIGANCVTGFNTDITRSYVGDSCWFHNNYIGDSVLDAGVSMGGGARLANLRLDDAEIHTMVKGVRTATGRNKLGAMIGTGVRIGVNATLMPGVKIGANTFVGSGVTVDADVAENSFVSIAKNSYTVSTNKHQGSLPARDAFKKSLA